MAAGVKRDTVFKESRKVGYLNAEGADKPLKSRVPPSSAGPRSRLWTATASRPMRRRWLCGVAALRPLQYPLRYAFDCSNTEVWCLHNPVRYALTFADGPASG